MFFCKILKKYVKIIGESEGEELEGYRRYFKGEKNKISGRGGSAAYLRQSQRSSF
jgi:hypothetical protein